MVLQGTFHPTWWKEYQEVILPGWGEGRDPTLVLSTLRCRK